MRCNEVGYVLPDRRIPLEIAWPGFLVLGLAVCSDLAICATCRPLDGAGNQPA